MAKEKEKKKIVCWWWLLKKKWSTVDDDKSLLKAYSNDKRDVIMNIFKTKLKVHLSS